MFPSIYFDFINNITWLATPVFFLANVIKKRSDDDVVTCESSQCFHKNGIEMSEEYLKFTASEVFILCKT